MYRRSDEFCTAEDLRKQGNSYSVITKTLGVPKSTLSNWFSNKKWSRSITSQLNDKYKEKNTNRLVQINRGKRLLTLARHNRYRQEASGEYKKLKTNPLFLTGLSIYWGEGDKSENGRVAVVNTDAGMLEVVVKFYTQVLKVPESKLRAAVFIYKDINENSALEYWSIKTKIPKAQFIKTQVLPSKNLVKRKVVNGICNVYFSSTELNIKINEWIRLLASEMRV